MRKWGKMPNQYKHTNAGEQVRFQSGMTSEQKFNSVAESVLSKLHQVETVKGCTMHPKISKKCRKCQQVQKNALIHESVKEEGWKISESFPEVLQWNTNFFKTHFNQKMQKNIEQSYFYKSKLKAILTVKDLSNSISPDQISIDAYMPGSNDMPTEFISYFYRLAELHPTRQQISIMLKANNVNVRCLILLYLRVYADPSIVYGCMNHSFKDNKLLSVMTIGEYAMRLFDEAQLNHGGFRIPRLPIKYQKEIDRKIAETKAQRSRKFERERSRSREKKRKSLEEEELKRAQNQRSSSSSSSESSESSEEKDRKQIKPPPPPIEGLTLKQKIRLLEQKNKANERRKNLLQSYKAEKVEKLQSQSEQYNENDEIQKYKMG